MRPRRNSETGQAAVLLALAFVGLLAFTALAIDGGNAYLTRRNAQNAADSAALGGTRAIQRLLHPMPGDPPVASPDTYVRVLVNDAAQRNGVADTNGDPQDEINAYVEAYYINASGDRVSDLQVGMQDIGKIPDGARGVEATVDIPFDSFIAGIIGRPTMQASASAGSIFNLSHTSVGAAIWANALNCDPNTLKLTGEQQIVNGTVHSNGDLHIAGNTEKPSVFTGTLEYAPDSEFSNNIVGAKINDPPDNAPVPTPPEDKADLFDIEDFAPDGVEAAEARARGEYHYLGQGTIGNKTLENAGLLSEDGVLAPGLYFTHGDFSLSGSITAVDVTLVARGDIRFSGSNHHFVHYEPQLLFFANGPGAPACNHIAIHTSSSMNTWYGFIYAPNGGVQMAHADNSALYGIIFAHTVDITGSNFQFNYDVTVDPLKPPTIVLVW
jgi:hypothetical protein